MCQILDLYYLPICGELGEGSCSLLLLVVAYNTQVLSTCLLWPNSGKILDKGDWRGFSEKVYRVFLQWTGFSCKVDGVCLQSGWGFLAKLTGFSSVTRKNKVQLLLRQVLVS